MPTKTQQERWGLNDRLVAEHVVMAVEQAIHRLDAIHEVMDALDYIRKQAMTGVLLNPPEDAHLAVRKLWHPEEFDGQKAV